MSISALFLPHFFKGSAAGTSLPSLLSSWLSPPQDTDIDTQPLGWSDARVMDNLPLTKLLVSAFVIEAVGATVIYLSPYSPDFSPIENCWSKVKEFLRARAARTYAELDQAISDALAAVTTKDIIGWFTHCCCYIPAN